MLAVLIEPRQNQLGSPRHDLRTGLQHFLEHIVAEGVRHDQLAVRQKLINNEFFLGGGALYEQALELPGAGLLLGEADDPVPLGVLLAGLGAADRTPPGKPRQARDEAADLLFEEGAVEGEEQVRR
jgi:hypothetical protein